jgi:hypothetical protein
MKRYKPYKFNEVEETDGGFFKGVYKDKARYFDRKEDAEKYEKEGGVADKVDAEKAKADIEKKDKTETEKDKKLGDIFDSKDGKYIGCVYDIEKGKDGKKDKKKIAYFKIDDYKTKELAIKAAVKKVKDSKPGLVRDILGSGSSSKKKK